MSYNWDSYLSPNEKVQVDFGVSKFYTTIVFGIITGLSLFLFFTNIGGGVITLVLGLAYWLYQTKGKRYTFTNKKIILVDTFLNKNVTFISYNKITDISIDQNMADMIGGWGNVIINTAGYDFAEAILHNVDNPQKVKAKIDAIAESSQKK